MDALRTTLVAVADLLTDARDDWWIIGSGAVWLHGAGSPPPVDIDVLVSPSDGRRLHDRLVAVAGSDDSDRRFRSALFGGWPGAPLPVEIMADLCLRVGEVWEPVCLTTREPVVVDAATLWVPAREELIALLRRFDRPKDHARAAALEALSSGR